MWALVRLGERTGDNNFQADVKHSERKYAFQMNILLRVADSDGHRLIHCLQFLYNLRDKYLLQIGKSSVNWLVFGTNFPSGP